MTSESKDMAAEVARGAALLAAGLETTEVSKAAELEKAANPFVKEDDAKKEDDKDEDDKKDVEKAMDKEELEKAVESAVEKALAPLMLILTGVQKSLEVAEGKANSTLAFQSASTAVLMSLKDVAVENVQVSKASAVVIDAVAAQPAGRKTVELGEIEKSAAVAQVNYDIDKLREISKGMDMAEWITRKKQVLSGDVSGLNPAQIRAITITGEK